MGGAFDGIGEGYREPTFRAVISAFILIMVAVGLVWLVWANLVYAPQQPGEQASAPPQVQRIDYDNPGGFK
ncbi:MAG TPA: hypothetical protein VFM74_06215 [Candidatus Limnocylindria bacterium]|nr:hypothetical protein [Candidatus Limnocylindria bacterium]